MQDLAHSPFWPISCISPLRVKAISPIFDRCPNVAPKVAISITTSSQDGWKAFLVWHILGSQTFWILIWVTAVLHHWGFWLLRRSFPVSTWVKFSSGAIGLESIGRMSLSQLVADNLSQPWTILAKRAISCSFAFFTAALFVNNSSTLETDSQ